MNDHGRFPLAASSGAPGRAAPSPARHGVLAGDGEGVAQTGRRILVADDEPDVRASLAELLRTLGHDVRTASDGEEALTIARRWQPGVVLLDVFMPRMSGFVVARLLRLQFERSQMRIVMMSGYPLDESTLESAGEAGFDACLDKGFDVERLEEAIAPNPPWSGFGPDFTSA